MTRRIPGLDAAGRAARRAVWISRIAGSGLVDLEYYGAQRRRTFRSARAAASDFLAQPLDEQLSFHPLLDGAWILRHAKSPARTWYSALFTPGRVVTSTSPVFDVVAAAGSDRHSSAAEVLAAFVARATAATVLPVSERAAEGITFAEARAVALDDARIVAEQLHRARPRESARWDARAEAAFRRRLRAHPLAGGGAGAPRVTVVMPVLDRADVIGDAIASVQAQSLADWELMVVDDGSTDGTAAVVAGFAERDPRVRLLTGAHEGVSAARNRGVAATSAPLLAFLDSDNVWTPDFLATTVGGLELGAPGGARADFAYSSVRRLSETGQHFLGGTSDYAELLDGANVIDLNALLVRREAFDAVGGFDAELRRWVDYDLELRMLRRFVGVHVPVVGVVYDHRASRADRITQSESQTWRAVVRAPHLIEWDAVEAAPRRRGRVSVLIVGRRDWESTLGTVRGVLETADGVDTEVVVIDNGAARSMSRLLRLAFDHDGRVRVLRLARDAGYSLSVDLAIAASTGEHLVLLNHVAKTSSGWTARLRAALDDPTVLGVQPLLRRHDGAVLGAGLLFYGPDELPGPFLIGHPLEDARRAARQRASAGSSGCLMMRAADLIAVRGPSLRMPASLADADLGLRMAEERRAPGSIGPTVRVLLDEVVTLADASQLLQPPPKLDRVEFLRRWAERLPDERDAYAAAGFRVIGREESQRGIAPPFGAPVVERNDRGRIQRWAIKTAAPAATRGDAWGDRHFADELAAALGSASRVVAVDRREAAERETAVFDDVTVTLRGLVRLPPVPGAINVLWVISHPESIADDELRDYQLVYAASASWAARATERSGVQVRQLLQATDPELFRAGDGPRAGTVFVGSTRGQDRRIVRWGVEAGLRPTVYGWGWRDLLPVDLIGGPSLPREEVAAVYGSAQFVLNDHWDDMAAEGFLSNRLFDAMAAGARVISDPVDGIEEVFGVGVAQVASREELEAAMDPASFPDPAAVARIVERVRREHSFAARAARLVHDVNAAGQQP